MQVTYNYSHCCVFDATIETNGQKGGDAGHGGYLNFTIVDKAGTDLEILHKDEELGHIGNLGEFTLKFRGDSEINGAIELFEFLGKHIREIVKDSV